MAKQNISVAAYQGEKTGIVGSVDNTRVIELVKHDNEWIVKMFEDITQYDVPSAITMMRVYNQAFAAAIKIDPDYFRQYSILGIDA